MRRLSFMGLLLTLLSILPSQAITRYVTANLNMRYEPTTRSQVVAVIPCGTAVEIDEDCTCKWVPVQYGNHIGYVSTKYLSKVRKTRDLFASRTTYNRSSSHSSYASTATYPTSSVRYYTNTYGNRVQSPTYYSSTPAGATALCGDGSYSFSQSRRGTCSHHGGVARWL